MTSSQQDNPCPDCGVNPGEQQTNDCDVTAHPTTEPTNGIRADAHTDDWIAVIDEFNATRYFEDASDEEIMELAECGWGGDYPSDEVAQFMADHDDRLAKMFRYLDAADDVSDDAPGFECHVNADDAMAWIAEHRPHLISRIQAWEEKMAAAAGGEHHE